MQSAGPLLLSADPDARISSIVSHYKNPVNDRALSIRQLLMWTTFLAAYFAIAGNLPNTPKSIAAGILIASAFICIDIKRRYSNTVGLSIAFFACGLAYCVASMLTVLAYLPEPTPPKPPMPFLPGQWAADALTQIGQAVAMVVTYFVTFAFFTLVSSILSLAYLRRLRGWKILLANAPGLLLMSYVAVAVAWGALNDWRQ